MIINNEKIKSIQDLERKIEECDIKLEKATLMEKVDLKEEKERLEELHFLIRLSNFDIEALYGIFSIGTIESVIADLTSVIVGCKYVSKVQYTVESVPYNSIKHRIFDSGYERIPNWHKEKWL